MRQIKIILLILISLLIKLGCIESYLPKDILESDENYVVWGRVTNNRDYHLVIVSKTSSLEYPKNIGISGCDVSIVDSDNNVFVSETQTIAGEYFVKIEHEHLTDRKSVV